MWWPGRAKYAATKYAAETSSLMYVTVVKMVVQMCDRQWHSMKRTLQQLALPTAKA